MGREGGSFRSALAHSDFRVLLAGLAVSTAGDWLYNVALIVFVFDRTHSSGWIAALTVARLTPYVALGPLGGVLAERHDRRRVMILSDLARAAIMFGLAIVASTNGAPAIALLLAF